MYLVTLLELPYNMRMYVCMGGGGVTVCVYGWVGLGGMGGLIKYPCSLDGLASGIQA